MAHNNQKKVVLTNPTTTPATGATQPGNHHRQPGLVRGLSYFSSAAYFGAETILQLPTGRG